MSRVTTLSLVFEAELARARAQWNEFVQEVESRPLKVNFEGSPATAAGGAATAPGARTFSGASGVPGGGSFIPAPISTAATAAAQGMPTLGPIQEEQRQSLLNQINRLQGHLGQPGLSNEGQDLLQTSIRGLNYQYVRKFGELPPALSGAPGETMSGGFRLPWQQQGGIASITGIGPDSYSSFGQAPGIEGLGISGRTRTSMYSAGGGGERPLALTSRGEAQLEKTSPGFSSLKSDEKLEAAANSVVAAMHQQAAEASASATAERRRRERVDRAFDQAGLAGQKADERRAARVDDTFDKAALAQQKMEEKTSEQAAKEAAKAKENEPDIEDIQREADMFHQRRLGGPPGGIIPSPTDEGGDDSAKRAFGFIRPLAAGYIFAHGIGALTNRILQEDAANRRMALSGSYDTLSAQVGEAYSDVSAQEGTLRPFVGGFFNNVLGRKIFTDRDTLGEVAEARKVQMAAEAGFSALRESRVIQSEAGQIGLTGLAAEFSQGNEADRQVLEALGIEERRFPSQPGFGAKRAAVLSRGGARLADIMSRSGLQAFQMLASADVIRESAAGHDWQATLDEMKSRQSVESFDLARATASLPLPLRFLLTSAMTSKHDAETQGLKDENTRKVEIAASRADWQIEVSQDTRRGYSHEALIAQAKSQFYDRAGFVTDDQGKRLDPTNPEFASVYANRTRQANEAVAVADRSYSQSVIMQSASAEAATLLANRNPIGAELRQLEANFGSATLGMDFTSPDFLRAQTTFFAQSNALQRQRADQNEMITAGVASERRGLTAALGRDYAGQRLEELTGSFEQRQLGLRDQDQRQQRLDTIKNEGLAINLFRQQYEDSFRGQALDTRLFSLQNPRDSEDPGKVLGNIFDKLVQVNDLLASMANEDS